MTTDMTTDTPVGGWQASDLPGSTRWPVTTDMSRDMTTDTADRRPVVWWAVLAVALCGVVATAHGLYSVARACGVGTPVAYLYVPITDGLALVAYASTARLVDGGRRYAWLVVVAAAGLSGLAQAVNLAGLGAPSWGLRFGVGYWPAVAVAVAAHLLWLVGERPVSRVREPLVEPAHHDPDEPVGEPPVLTVVSPPGEPAHEPPVSPRPARKVSPAVSPRRRSLTAATVRCDDGCAFPSGCAGTVAPATRKRHRAWRREQGEGET